MQNVNSELGQKARKKKSLSYKTLLTTSTATTVMMIASPAYAQLQVTPNVDAAGAPGTASTVASGTNVVNPGTNDFGALIESLAGTTHAVSSGSNIDLNDDQNDTFIVISGTVTNTATNDEQVAIFIDNAEDAANVTVNAGGALNGTNGVIFFEGDEAVLTNNGTITGTGNASEGVVYFDRDADDNENVVINNGTITSFGGPTIGFDALLGDVPSSSEAAAATLAAPVEYSGFGTLTLTNTGTISNSDGADDGDSDAININGDPGNTGDGSDGGGDDNPRGCLETTNASADLTQRLTGSDIRNLNCQVNLNITNSGVISTARDSGSNAGIVIENDAVLIGNDSDARSNIINQAGGQITGAGNGIIVNGAHADHALLIDNAGTITGTSTDGISIRGAGVDLVNSGTIVGGDTGVEVESSTITIRQVLRTPGNGASIATDVDMDGDLDFTEAVDVPIAAVNNTFVNSGTIMGGTFSVDLDGAGEAVTFEQQGGALTGDFRGSSAFTDMLNITGADPFTLTHDVLQNVNVDIAAGSTLWVDGARTIEGSLVNNGELSFILGTDTLAVSGDTTLNTGSVVDIADTNGVVTAAGQTFDLITTGGTLTNNSTLMQSAVDNSFLLDFTVVNGANVLTVVSENAVVTPTPVTPTPVAPTPVTPTPVTPTPVTPTPVTPTPVTPTPVTPTPTPTDADTAAALAAAAAAAAAAQASAEAAEASAAAAEAAAAAAQAEAAAAQAEAAAAQADADAALADAQAALAEAEAAQADAEAVLAAQAEADAAAAAAAANAFSSPDSNLNGLGTSIVAAFNDEALGDLLAGQLANVPDNAAFGEATLALTPQTNNASLREVFEAANTVTSYIDRRFNDNCNEDFEEASDRDFATCEAGWWTQGGYQVTDQNDLDSATLTGYDANVFTLAIGYDHALTPNTLIGISGAYSQIDVDQNRGNLSEENIDVLNVTGYIGHKLGPWFANGQIGLSNASVNTDRLIALTNEAVSGSFDTNGINVQGTVGYDVDLKDAGYLTPFVGVHVGDYNSDDHTEIGGLNLEIEGSDVTYIEGKAGVITGNVIDLNESQLNVFARGAYVIDFDGNISDFNVAFGNAQSVSLNALQSDDERVELGAGVDWRNQNGFTLGFEVDAEVANDYRSVGGFLRLKYKL